MPSITILGASRDRSKISHQTTHEYVTACWDVYPVNPNIDTIAGIKAYSSIKEVPVPSDIISVYVPPHITTQELDTMKAAMPEAVVVFNPGSFDSTTLERANELGITHREICSLTALQALTKEFTH